MTALAWILAGGFLMSVIALVGSITALLHGIADSFAGGRDAIGRHIFSYATRRIGNIATAVRRYVVSGWLLGILAAGAVSPLAP